MSRSFYNVEEEGIYFSETFQHPSGAWSMAIWRKTFNLRRRAGWRHLIRAIRLGYGRRRVVWNCVLADTRWKVPDVPIRAELHGPNDPKSWVCVSATFPSHTPRYSPTDSIDSPQPRPE